MALFAPDAAVEDLTLRTRVRGPALLPGAQPARAAPAGTGRRVLGGGHEWTNDAHPARRGLTAVALDDGRIADLTAVWSTRPS